MNYSMRQTGGDAAPPTRLVLRFIDWLSACFNMLVALMFIGGIALLLVSSMTGEGSGLVNGDADGHSLYARSWILTGSAPESRVKYPCGVSMIGVIGYAPSVLVTKALRLEGEGYEEHWGLLNQFCYCLPFFLLGFIALRWNLATLRQLGFSDNTIKPLLLFWIAGTNIGYYFFKEPAMSETSTYCSVSLYYYLLLKYFYRSDAKDGSPKILVRGIWVGLALGFAGIIRQQNILHCFAAPLLIWFKAGADFKGDIAGRIKRVTLSVAPIAFASAIVFAIPYAVWEHATGNGGAWSYGAERFNFTDPDLFSVLFSFAEHGALLWNPIFLLAAIGWIFLFKKHPRLALPILVPALMQYYLIASWWGSSFGASFGHRGFFTVFPALLPGLAALFHWLKTRHSERFQTVGWIVLGILTAINLILMLLLSLGLYSPIQIELPWG